MTPGLTSEPGLYIHVPFCRRICPYCDFAVLGRGRKRESRYVEHVLRELEERACSHRFDTVYLGGGTPSVLDASDLAAISSRASLAPDAWLSLEANPEDVSQERVHEWRELGVRTLSLGVQAFDDVSLAFLGRGHTAAQAVAAVELAREAGFDAVSVDLIYGLPSQSLADWRKSLEVAVALEPEHLSCYQLTVHEKTLLERHRREGRPVVAEATLCEELFFETHDRLAEAGYDGYEVSNFARGPSHRSRHNQKYWDHTPYVGVGPSAHSFDGETRSWNVRSFHEWSARIERGSDPTEGRERLSAEQRLLERVMLGLRTRSGIDWVDLSRRYGVDLLEANRPAIERWIRDDRLVLDGDFLRPTLRGLAVAESLAASFRIPGV